MFEIQSHLYCTCAAIDSRQKDRVASKCMALRLVVEDIRSNGGELYRFSTHEDGHFGVKRTYDTIASKYNVKQHVSWYYRPFFI